MEKLENYMFKKKSFKDCDVETEDLYDYYSKH
jgi:hypothetical protein